MLVSATFLGNRALEITKSWVVVDRFGFHPSRWQICSVSNLPSHPAGLPAVSTEWLAVKDQWRIRIDQLADAERRRLCWRAFRQPSQLLCLMYTNPRSCGSRPSKDRSFCQLPTRRAGLSGFTKLPTTYFGVEDLLQGRLDYVILKDACAGTDARMGCGAPYSTGF